MTDLKHFTKPGLWLAVVTKNGLIKVIAAAKTPKKALESAQNKGIKNVSLMMSARRYGSWST